MDINNIVLSSRIRLARNLKDLPYTPKQTELSAEKVLNMVFAVAKTNLNFDTYKLKNLTDEEVASALDNNFISKDVDLNFGGYAISNDETVSIMVNEEDHIRMQCIITGLNLKKAFDIINDIDTELMQNLDYAYDKELGFLTTCPSNLGTGIRASCMMFLPALTISGNLEELVKPLKNLGIIIRGINGEGSDSKGYVYQISNEVTLGKSEKQIIQEVESAVFKIFELEKEVIEKIKQSNDINLFDTIMRSFGTLISSYKLSSSEYFELSALSKLGVELDLIKLKNIEIFDELNYAVKPANLIKISGKFLNDIERDVFRAKFVSAKLKSEIEFDE